MTSRVTFGDFAEAITHHLDDRASGTKTIGSRTPAAIAAEVHEYAEALRVVLKVMVRYMADLNAAAKERSSQELREATAWDRARSQASNAVQAAYRNVLRADHLMGHASPGRAASPAVRSLRAAVTAMTAGRDLLHTHFASTPDGRRHAQSEWAPIIASPPVSNALLTEVAGWARQITAHGSYLNAGSVRLPPALLEELRLVNGAFGKLFALSAAVEKAQSREPLAEVDTRQLHAVPTNVLQPRRLPSPTESIEDLCQGTADSAERIRRAAALAASEAAMSPWVNAESFGYTASFSAIISHNCEILQQTLAARAAQLGAADLSKHLLASAKASGTARLAWLDAARAWRRIRTDAEDEIAPAAAEASDLAHWTGRLAYSDPDWNPSLGAGHDYRRARELAPEAADFSAVLNAAHQAAKTLTAIAAADYSQIRTAALNSRILVQKKRELAADESEPVFVRATPRRAEILLNSYRGAGAASVQAAARIAAAATEAESQPYKIDDVQYGRQMALVAGLENPSKEMPGPVERILRELGVTEQELLNRGIALDKAATELVTEAALETAPQRWHAAVKSLGSAPDTASIIDHMLLKTRRHEQSAQRVALHDVARPTSNYGVQSPQAEP
jgi:hypothetical protein